MKKILYCFSIVVFTGTTGCNSKNINALAEGYEKVTITHKSIIMEPDLVQVQLRHKTPEGKIAIVWPSLRSEPFITNGVAVFVGERTLHWSKVDQRWGTGNHLFAVKAPETPVDISDEVIRHWAKASGKDIDRAVKEAGLIGGAQHPDGTLDLYYEFESDWPGAHVLLSWNQVTEIMKQVPDNGSLHKDQSIGATYIVEGQLVREY